MQDPPTDTDVLIVGSGFAGVACAQRLERRLPKTARVTLVSSENHFVFQPLLPEVVGAALSPSHVTSPVRQLLRRADFFRCEVEHVGEPDPADGRRDVTTYDHETECRRTFRARHVVLSPGSIVDASRIPGMAEHSLPIKNVADALALREQVLRRLESAANRADAAERQALLTFVVVGGGFSGVETAAEVNDLLRASRRYFPQLDDDPMRVLCVHARERLLPELPERLGEHAHRALARRGVEFLLSARTRSVSSRGVYLDDGRFVPARTVVCTIGNAPHPLLRRFAGDDGRVVTDAFLRVPDQPGLWAIGDCARAPDGHGGVCPPTAQFASRQGAVAADNIARALRDEAPRAFRHRSLGQLATLGHRRAVAAIGPLRLTGVLAWWLWRTVYLLKLPRFDRKLRVMLEWTLSLFFPRDLNAVSMKRSKGPNRIHLEAGETLFRQGDPSSAFFIVERGHIQLLRCNDQGRAVARDLLGPGEHFGEGSLLRAGKRTTTAVASESTTVLSFPADAFDQLIRHFGKLRSLLESTSTRFQPTDDILPSWLPAAQLDAPVGDYMTREVFSLPEQTTLTAGLREMLGRRIHALPLVDAEGRLSGLCTSSDLFSALRRDTPLDQPLAELCTRRVRTVEEGADLRHVVEIMRRFDVKHVVITGDHRRIGGIISVRDVLSQLLTDDARQPEGIS